MGANSFLETAPRRGKQDGFDEIVQHGMKYLKPRYVDYASPDEAFDALVDQSLHEHGSSYSGEIGMKRGYGFKLLDTCQTLEAAEARAIEMLHADHPAIAEKFGPAGCIAISEGEIGWIFFGYASS